MSSNIQHIIDNHSYVHVDLDLTCNYMFFAETILLLYAIVRLHYLWHVATFITIQTNHNFKTTQFSATTPQNAPQTATKMIQIIKNGHP